ncbi:MAG: glycosyltransferase family 9 protein, partial [Armatimonadota bacterium]
MNSDIKNIMVMRLDQLGDIILTIPALRTIRETFPHANIHTLVPKSFSDIRGINKYSDVVLGFEKENFLNTVLEIRKTKFDLAVDFLSRADNLSAVIMGLIRAEEKLSFNVGLRRLVLNRRFNLENKDLYEVDITFKLLESIGIKGTSKELELDFEEKDKISVGAYLGKKGVNLDDNLIGIQTMAKTDIKAWPVEKFVELTKTLLSKYPVKIVLTGSSSERKKVEESFKNLLGDRVILAAGDITLNQLTALMGRFKVFISNNTGPMHIAAALGTPLLLINGYSSLLRWGPHKGNNFVVKKDYPCAPCEF